MATTKNSNTGDAVEFDEVGVVKTPVLNLQAQTSEVEQVENQDTVSVMVLEGGDYVEKILPRPVAATITENMMRETWEQAGSDRMDTEKYHPGMRRCFVNKDRSDPATVASFERGYVPCRDKKAALASGHQFGKVEGWEGEVAYIGDAVLLHCPNSMVEAREARLQHNREMHRQNAISEAKNSMEAILDPYRRNGDNRTMVTADSAYTAREEAISGGNTDRAMQQAMAVQAAMERDRSYGHEAPSKQTFGGFNGTPEYNKGVPDSPFFRRAVQKVIGG